MIKALVSEMDDICQECPFFSPEMDHVTNYFNTIHTISITCEHYTLCEYLKNRIRKEKKNDNAND